MARSKVGPMAEGIFAVPARPAAAPAPKPKPSRLPAVQKSSGRTGRPPSALAGATKVTVVLTAAELAWLDRLAIDIRSRTGKPVERSAILRAVVDAVHDAGLDLARSADEAAIRETIAAKLRR